MEKGMSRRISEWANADFSIPSFSLPEIVDEFPLHIPWFDSKPKPMTAGQGLPPDHRMKALKKLTSLYNKLAPSNALLIHELAKEEEDELFRNNPTVISYNNAFMRRFQALSLQIELLPML
jgi:hypothetical protein